MIRQPPRSTRTDTLFPYTTLFRSAYEVPVVKGATPTFTVDAPAPFAILPFTLGEVRAPQVRDIRLEKGVHVTGKVKVPPGQPAPTELMWLDFTASIAGVYQPMPSHALQPPDFEYSPWVVRGSARAGVGEGMRGAGRGRWGGR